MIPLLLACTLAQGGSAADPHTAMLDADAPNRCIACHADTPEWTGVVQPAALCEACHTAAPHAGAHKVQLSEAMEPRAAEAGLPVTADGAVVCTSCHDPHPPGVTGRTTQDVRLLRLPPDELCVGCHSLTDMDAEDATRSP